jgi:hypothetical protein
LWKNFRQRDFPTENNHHELPVIHPKEEYAALFQGKLQIRDRKVLTRKLRDCALLCRYLQQVVCFLAPLPFLITLILLLVNLSSSEKEPLSWAIFSPALIGIFTSFFFLIWGSVLWMRGNCLPCFHWRLFGLMIIPNLPVPSISSCVVGTGAPTRLRSGMIVFLTIVHLILASILLVVLKLSGVIGLPHWATLIPAFAACLFILLLPLTSCRSIDQGGDLFYSNKWISAAGLCFIIFLPPLITLELFFLRLDGKLAIHAAIALIPMFFQNIVVLTGSVIAFSTSRVAVFIMTFTPWIVFEIFLSLRDWNENLQIDILSVFLPLIIGLAAVSVLGMFVVAFLTIHYSNARRLAQTRDLQNPIEQIP